MKVKTRTRFLILPLLLGLIIPMPGANATTGSTTTTTTSAVSGSTSTNSPTSGGTASGGADRTGCIDRRVQYQELNGNDALINNLCGLMKVEVGGMTSECKQMFLESVMNRSYANDTTVANTISNNGYWGAGGKRLALSSAEFAECKTLLDNVLNGSNLSNFATDNASDGGSGSTAVQYFGTNRQQTRGNGVWCNGNPNHSTGFYNTELFYIDNGYKAKMEKLKAEAASKGCASVGGVNGGSAGGTGQDQSSSTGGGGSVDYSNPPQVQKDTAALWKNLEEAIRNIWMTSLMLMAEQFTTNMIAQLDAVGMMLDAKHQLETQRLLQQKMARAHKDYQPSEQVCTFGTFTRDLMNTERSADLTRASMAQRVLERDIGSGNNIGMSADTDLISRLATFRDKFCNPKDNGQGLKLLCKKAADAKTQNKDINYTETIDQPLSLEINLTDDKVTDDETSVFALIDNLFAHTPITRVPDKAFDQKQFRYYYMNLRSIAALRGIARNSFSNIIALKTASPDENTNTSAKHIRALMTEFGLSDEEIEKIIGKNPSYYAQMEILTKKIYQNPNFYTELYDKPANVKRIRAAMEAIKLMQDRDIQASLLRREMLLSTILELRLRERADDVYTTTERFLYEQDLN